MFFTSNLRLTNIDSSISARAKYCSLLFDKSQYGKIKFRDYFNDKLSQLYITIITNFFCILKYSIFINKKYQKQRLHLIVSLSILSTQLSINRGLFCISFCIFDNSFCKSFRLYLICSFFLLYVI